MNITKKKIQVFRKDNKRKNKILEVGCSSGFMLFDLKKKAIFVMGLNPLVFSKIFEKKKDQIIF